MPVEPVGSAPSRLHAIGDDLVEQRALAQPRCGEVLGDGLLIPVLVRDHWVIFNRKVLAEPLAETVSGPSAERASCGESPGFRWGPRTEGILQLRG